MRFIGDVHAKFEQYLKIISKVPQSIQVGDFGAGFRDIPQIGYSHRWIRGNHDDPTVARNHHNWIEDGYHEGEMTEVRTKRNS